MLYMRSSLDIHFPELPIHPDLAPPFGILAAKHGQGPPALIGLLEIHPQQPPALHQWVIEHAQHEQAYPSIAEVVVKKAQTLGTIISFHGGTFDSIWLYGRSPRPTLLSPRFLQLAILASIWRDYRAWTVPGINDVVGFIHATRLIPSPNTHLPTDLTHLASDLALNKTELLQTAILTSLFHGGQAPLGLPPIGQKRWRTLQQKAGFIDRADTKDLTS